METKEQSKIQKLMKSKPAKAGVSVALVGTLALAGIGAYFTGTDTVENKFDISAGLTDKITVVEENWDTTDADTNGIPDAAEHVVPLQTIAKDPVVKNESDVEAWLFCQIKVPTANVSVVGEDGTPEAAASHELFTYTVNEGWTESGTPVVADGYTTHTYLYNTKVAANSQTAKAVFDDVTLINLVEAQGVSGPDQIDVIGTRHPGRGPGHRRCRLDRLHRPERLIGNAYNTGRSAHRLARPPLYDERKAST